MAWTIKDMALAKYPHFGPWGGIPDLYRREGFEIGAKAVLEEIEKIVNNRNWVAFPKASITELREKIKKFKGE